MAFPTLLNTPTGLIFGSAISTTHNITLPATISDGDLILVYTANNGNSTGTTPTDWTLVRELNDHDWLRVRLYALECDGTEDGSTVNFQTSAAEGMTAFLLHYQTGSWSAYTVSAAGQVTGDPGAGLGLDPPSVTASGGAGDHAWHVAGSVTGNIVSGTSGPTGYSVILDFENSPTGDEDQTVTTLCIKEANAASDDPDDITWDDDDHSAVMTFVVEGVSVTETETGHAWFDLTAMPIDFESMLTAGIVPRTRGQNFGAGTVRLYCRIYESDETTPLTDELHIATATTDSSFANASSIPFTGVVAADKATWDAARIRFHWTYQE